MSKQNHTNSTISIKSITENDVLKIYKNTKFGDL